MTDTSEVSTNGKFAGASGFARVELVWPGKDLATKPYQSSDGVWRLGPPQRTRRLSPIVNLARHDASESGASVFVVSGDRVDALETLKRHYPQRIQLAYLDLPRIEVDDEAAAFQGDKTYIYSTWLSVVRSHLAAVIPLMKREGVVAIHTGDLEEPYARLVASETECMGRDNYIGTIVWQRSYGPRNMRGMKEITATHDCIILFAVDKAALAPVGLRLGTDAAGYANSDGDPRLDWKATHKGAKTRRENSDFNTYMPPYRWRIVEGKLPAGLWRLNPLTGVIWGIPTEVGEYKLLIEATDREGRTATKLLGISIRDSGEAAELANIPWIFEEIVTSGKLRIETQTLPEGAIGKRYSAVCIAAGGAPFVGPPKRPGSGRYWEFADHTLRQAYAEDAVDLGDGTVIPRIKTYAKSLGDQIIQNQQTWWPARTPKGDVFAGFTQDATKHLKKLKELGFITEAVTIAKPEHLLAKLLNIFTPSPNDVALEVFGTAGDLASVAIKMGKPSVYLAGSSERDLRLLEACALPRIRAVIDGKDRDLERVAGEIRLNADMYMPFDGGGTLIRGHVGEWLFEERDQEEVPQLNRVYDTSEALSAALLTSQGFIPEENNSYRGSSSDRSSAIVVPPEDYLTADLAADLITESTTMPLTIFYFMASPDFDSATAPTDVTYRRVPVEIALI